MTKPFRLRAGARVRVRNVCALSLSATAISFSVACGHVSVDHHAPLGSSGVRPGVSVFATWDEPNASMPSGYEHIYGQLSQAPAGAINVHVVDR